MKSLNMSTDQNHASTTSHLVQEEKVLKVKDGAISDQVVSWLLFAFCVAILAAFLGLTPIGFWQDEWVIFADFFHDPSGTFWARLSHWSPRPLAESLVFMYALAVKFTQRPLIGTILGTLWLFLALALLLPSFIYRDKSRADPSSIMPGLLVSLSLFCMFLLGHPIREMFYWPQAALAYMPLLAAVSFLFGAFVKGHVSSRDRQLAYVLAMVTAAASSEIGAVFVVIFLVTISFVWLISMRHKTPISSLSSSYRKISYCWLLPLCFSVFILILYCLNRVKPHPEIYGDPLIARHFGYSLNMAIPSFVRIALLSVDGKSLTGYSILFSFTQKALFFVGCYGALLCVVKKAISSHTARYLLVLAFTCFTTSFLIAWATLYQFGLEADASERHGTMLRCLFFVGLASSAGYLAYIKIHKSALTLCPVSAKLHTGCLMLSVLIPGIQTAPQLFSDYRNYQMLLSIKIDNWNAGKAPGDTMLYRQTSVGKVVIPAIKLPSGIYTTSNSSLSPHVAGMLRLFHKKSVIVESPAP